MTTDTHIVQTLEKLLAGTKLSELQHQSLINAFYQDDNTSYGYSLLEAWDNLPDIKAEDKFVTYLMFITETVIALRDQIAENSKISLLDLGLDQVAILGGVLDDSGIKSRFDAEFSNNLIECAKILPIPDLEIMLHLANVIIPHTQGFKNDKTNQLNQDFVRLVINFNRSSKISDVTLHSKGCLWEYMNAIHIHRATYSLLRVEAAKPGTFSEDDINTLKNFSQATQQLNKDSMNKSSEWNFVLLNYIKNGEGLDALQQMYEQSPEKRKGFDNDLQQLNIQLYATPSMDM